MSDEPPGPAGDREGGRLGALLSIEGDALDRAFAVLLFLFFGVLLAATPRYSPDSRLFPIVIGVPSILLLAALILAQSSERVGALVSGFASSDVFGFDERFSGGTADGGEEETLYDRRKRLVVIALWMVLLFVLVLVVGFIPATVAFLLGFYRLYADVGWPRTVGYTVVFTAMVILVFDVVMGTRLYTGLLGVGLPL